MTSTEHALYIGPQNSELLTGLPWRRVRDLALRLGVRRVQCGRATLVPVAAFRAVIDAANMPAAEASDPADEVRRALGRRRAAP
ncbi:MAG: hypothetical protein IT348_20030 [Candidatus Eisenbacteria bacterium]|nr:hypothetical protein [Candidatus Eisenbacteria bacterium]